VIIVPRCGGTNTGKKMPKITYNFKNKNDERLYDSQEAAEFMNYHSRATMANLRYKNEGPDYVYVDKKIMYRESVLIRYKAKKDKEKEKARAKYVR
jgi:hypothetical protein